MVVSKDTGRLRVLNGFDELREEMSSFSSTRVNEDAFLLGSSFSSTRVNEDAFLLGNLEL